MTNKLNSICLTSGQVCVQKKRRARYDYVNFFYFTRFTLFKRWKTLRGFKMIEGRGGGVSSKVK